MQQERLKDGSRKITSITEVQGMEGDVIVMQDIFVFEQTGVEGGKIVGRMKPTGVRPKFIEKFEVGQYLSAAEHLRIQREVSSNFRLRVAGCKLSLTKSEVKSEL